MSTILKCLSVITADVRYSTVYTCAACEDGAVGATCHKTIRAHGVDNLIAALRDEPQQAESAPPGWTEVEGTFLCRKCKPTQKEES